jgi:hypothetical protein
VCVDEARQQRGVAEVDDLRGGQRGAADGFNLVAADDHYGGRDHALAFAVDQARGSDDERCLGGEYAGSD